MVAATVTSPDGLETALLHALVELPPPGQAESEAIDRPGHTASVAEVVSVSAPVGRLDHPVYGRDSLVGQLSEALHGPYGEIHVLTGMGGAGKTTAALDAARRAGGMPVWWVQAPPPRLCPPACGRSPSCSELPPINWIGPGSTTARRGPICCGCCSTAGRSHGCS